MSRGRILFVEDSETQSKTIGNYLESKGYDVTVVEDGKSAINAAMTDPPDLVLLDFILPDINGDEVCRTLKLNKSTKDIPIIMLTVKGAVSEKVKGIEAGADDYIPKPFDGNELNARIYACLRTKVLQDELKEKNSKLEKLLVKAEMLAVTDPLTGLFNRRHFETVLDKEFKIMKRYNTQLACMMIDIDHFKKINDEYGHNAGDSVLQEIAEIINNTLREIDILARWGGEEFVVLLPQTGKESAVHSASRVLHAISSHKFALLPGINVTVSIGIATAPSAAIPSSEKLIDFSDTEMYKAKKNGRCRIETA